MSLSVPTKPLNGGFGKSGKFSGEAIGLFAGLLTGSAFAGAGVADVSPGVASAGGESIPVAGRVEESGFGFPLLAR